MVHEVQGLAPSGGVAVGINEQFGQSISLSGDLAVVGVPGNLVGGVAMGAAMVYREDSCNGLWGVEKKLVAQGGLEGGRFGDAVACDGSVVVVGAPNDSTMNNRAGSAYVFRHDVAANKWREEQKLMALPGELAALDRFGFSVAVAGEVVLIGVPFANDACPGNVQCDSGAAMVYRFDGEQQLWLREARLTASDAMEGDNFGFSVAMEGEVVVIGAYREDGVGVNSGAVYVFRRSPPVVVDRGEGGVGGIGGLGAGGWVEEAKLVSPDGAAGNEFGKSVAIQGGRIAVGAPRSDLGSEGNPNFDSGAAYVFEYQAGTGVWVAGSAVVAANGQAADIFGGSVALLGETLLVGGIRTSVSPGGVWMFRREAGSGAWVEKSRFAVAGGVVGDQFGGALGLRDDLAFVGASRDGQVSANGGAAYVFAGLNDCSGNGEPDLCDIAMGLVVDENGNGVPDECDPAPCPGDCYPPQGDCEIGMLDLIILLNGWEDPAGGPCDLTGPADGAGVFGPDGVINVLDLIQLLNGWGPCP